MAERNDWKLCLDWVDEQIKKELAWAEKCDDNEDHKRGMIFAYRSIQELVNNLKKYGYEGYKDICDDRWQTLGTD